MNCAHGLHEVTHIPQGIMTDVSLLVSPNQINQLRKIVPNDSLFLLFRTKHKLGLLSLET